MDKVKVGKIITIIIIAAVAIAKLFGIDIGIFGV